MNGEAFEIRCQDTDSTLPSSHCLTSKIAKHRSPGKGTRLPLPMCPPAGEAEEKRWSTEIRDWTDRVLIPTLFEGNVGVQACYDQCSPIRLARVMAGPLHNTAPEPQGLGQTSGGCCWLLLGDAAGQLAECHTFLGRFAIFVWTTTIVSQDFDYAPSRVTDPH